MASNIISHKLLCKRSSFLQVYFFGVFIFCTERTLLIKWLQIFPEMSKLVNYSAIWAELCCIIHFQGEKFFVLDCSRSRSGAHTRFTGTAGRVHCVRIFTHFPCYEPACWSLNFMHFQTSVIRLVDRLTWFYRFGITLRINLSPKVCDLSVMFWINIYKLGLKKYPLKSRNFGNLVCLYLGYHGNYTRFICF